MTVLTIDIGWLAHLLCSHRVPGSNTILKTGYTEWNYVWFPSLAQEQDKRRAVVNTVTNHRVPPLETIFLTSSGTVSLSGRILLQGVGESARARVYWFRLRRASGAVAAQCGKYFIAGFHEAFAKTGNSLWVKRPKKEDPKGTISL